MMELVDTHCHIQFDSYGLAADDVISAAHEAGVTRLLCVGCTIEDSEAAVNMAEQHQNIWATIGLHPHESAVYVNDPKALQRFRQLATKPRVVGIGETGLDFYYNHSSKSDQIAMLRYQLELGLEHNLPFIFHVREAFDDFWTILNDFPEVRGVVHSFTGDSKELERILAHNLYVGLNGILTFTKDTAQLTAAKAVPLEKILLETDAPFLTPAPFRGKICEPKHVGVTAEFLADLRGESLDRIAKKTTSNAQKLFNLL